jgi:magnesium transporter
MVASNLGKLVLVHDALREKNYHNHAVLNLSMSVLDARNELPNLVSDPKKPYYIYVVNDAGILVGTISVHELFVTDAKNISDLNRTNFDVLREMDSVETAKVKFHEKRYFDLPVISQDGTFKGTISIFDLTGIQTNIQSKAENDLLFRILGIDIQKLNQSSFIQRCITRMWSLIANVIGGTICAVVLFYAGTELNRILALTLFMPVLLTITEAISGQAVAISIETMMNGRGMVSSQTRNVLKSVLQEAGIGAMVGLAAGIASLALAYILSLWFPTGFGIQFISIFLLTVFLGGLCAAVIGNAVPRFIDKFLPKHTSVAANPYSLAISDIATLLIYLLFILLIAR